MNWKLIFALSIFGLAMGIASVLGFVPPRFEWLYWLIIALISAFVVAKKAAAKLFLHGFLVGLIGGIIAPILAALFFSTYLANNPSYAEQFQKMPVGMNPVVYQLILAPFIAAVYGLVLGFFAWLAGKIFKKQPTLSATN